MTENAPAGARKSLVMGANGFLGSHVTRRLVERGDAVRVMIRRSGSTEPIDDLAVERHYGDIFDDDAVRAAMAGVDVVYYCVVDTRAGLRDHTPLFRTNVEGLRHVLDIAADAGLHRFVFTSTIGTLAIGGTPEAPVTEEHPFNWHGKGGPYIDSRRQAEDMVLRYARERGLPAVALCVSNTYGPRDWQPTPHGSFVLLAARGKLPVYLRGVGSEVVGVEDAAEALILAGEHGRVGERYIVSESYMTMREILETAADEAGAKAPRVALPVGVLYAGAYATDLAWRFLRRDYQPSLAAARLLHLTSPLDHSKATRELGWKPSPTADSIRRAAQFYLARPGRKRAR